MATLNILYEDPHILVCVKPHGIATQSKSIRYPDMVSLIKNHLAKASGTSGKSGAPKSIGSRTPGSAEPYLAVIHRLDQPVAGILVFAKTPAAAKDLNKQLQNQGFGKYYRALVTNAPSEKEGTLEDYMVKDARTNTSRICSAKVSQLNLLPQGKPEALRRAKAMLSKMDELGFGNCTNTRACEAECPKNISISNIARLNRDFIIAKLKD